MFRDVYKSANDDIIPDSQLLDKILSNGITPKKSRGYYRYASAAAALLIFAGALAVYPKITAHLTNAGEAPTVYIESTVQPASTDLENDFVSTDEAVNQPVKSTASPKIENPSKKSAASPSVSPKAQAASGIKKPDNALADVNNKASSDEVLTTPTAQADSTPESANVFKAEVPLIAEEQPIEENAVSVHSEVAYSTASGGGAAYARLKRIQTAISEEEAIAIADEAFSSDFGEEFLNSTSIRSEYDNEYIITRYNDTETKVIIISDDGEIKKQYKEGE